MRKLITISLFLYCSFSSFSQSADKSRIKLNVGAGLGVLETSTNTEVRESGIAVPTITTIGIEYNTRDRLSIGMEFFSHTYNTDDSTIVSIGGGAIGVDLKYFFINKPKFNAFIGTSLGGINIVYNGYHYPDSNNLDTVRKDVWFQASGIYNKVYLGFNKYFGKLIGLYVKCGYLNAPYQMKNVTIDNEKVDYFDRTPVSSWKTLLRGGFISLGISLKFGNRIGEEKVLEDETSI